jgi:integrase
MMATYQKRGKKWRAIIRIKGQSRSRSFPTKTAAKEWATRVENEINTGKIHKKQIPPRGLTVWSLIDEYVDTVSRGAKPFGRSKLAVLNMLKRELGNIAVKDIDQDVLDDFVDRRRLQGAGGVTIGIDLSVLTTLFSWARVRKRLEIPLEPIQDCRKGMQMDGIRTKSTERDRRPTDEELERLYSHWENKKRQKIPMVDICKFAIATGMRQSEITRIQWDDLDADNKTVVIRKRKHPKEPKDQTVPLLDAAGYDAWALIQSQPQKGARIFPYDPKSVSTNFTRAHKALKIEDLHFHDLRHEATSRLFKAGYQIQEVALVTGHNDWKMLQRYTQLRPEDLHNKHS